MKVWVHTLVRNEENYIWYAIMSIIDHVDKVLIWDTGSTDKTVQIIGEIKKLRKEKVEFREYGQVSAKTFTKARQEMLEQTDSDWVLVVDGDEVWSEDGLRELNEIIDTKKPHAIVSPFWSVVGDIYHYQEEKAGKYTIGGKTGFHTIRAFQRNIPGLHIAKPFHKGEGLYDATGISIQERKHIVFQEEKYFHFGNLPRSRDDASTMGRSVTGEIGIPFTYDFYYPEVLFKPRPQIVLSPWQKISGPSLWRAKIDTPFRWVKRRLPWM